MESASQVNVPLRSGGKKMRKRRELDALVAHSLAKRANKKSNAGNGVNSQDQLLSPSTDEQDDIAWPKIVRSTNRTRNRKFSLIQSCLPFVFVTTVALSLGFVYWLHFDLKQQLYEYRSRIEGVAITSQNLPDALQKWHETSKSLEQNQTIIYGKIADLQHRIEELSTQLTLYGTKLNEKKDYSKDEQVVANFGAKVEAVAVDVERMKERLNELENGQSTFRLDLNTLKSNFSEAITKATNLANSNETNYSHELQAAKTFILDEIKSVATNLSIVNDTLSQKNKNVEEEILLNKKTLEVQADKSANVSSRVDSLKFDLAKYKTVEQDFEAFKKDSTSEFEKLINITNYLESSINEIHSKYNRIPTITAEPVNPVIEDNSNKDKVEPAGRKNLEIYGGVGDKTLNSTGLVIPTEQSNSKTTANSSTRTTENSVEGKPKLLSMQTIDKPL